MQFNIRMYLTAEVLIFTNKKQLILVHSKKKTKPYYLPDTLLTYR